MLADTQVVKFLHAGSEDLEVFINALKTLPTPMIDTQILAAFAGRTLSCGFATLVAEYMQVELDKSEVRTDWLACPLTEKQCVYAAVDVFYLLPMAKQLVQETEEACWASAANNETLLLCQRRSEMLSPELWPTAKSAMPGISARVNWHVYKSWQHGVCSRRVSAIWR